MEKIQEISKEQAYEMLKYIDDSAYNTEAECSAEDIINIWEKNGYVKKELTIDNIQEKIRDVLNRHTEDEILHSNVSGYLRFLRDIYENLEDIKNN